MTEAIKRWLATLMILLCASGASGQDQLQPSENSGSGMSRLELGRATYQAVCASCHDTSADGAPVIGVAEDWAGRSNLWQSVLFQHAEKGYLSMPAQAGDSGELDRSAVDAAAEYMLMQNYPDRHPD